MKSIKYLVMLACVTFGLIMSASAQIYSNEVCFYQEVDDPAYIYAIKFDNSKIFRDGKVKQNLANSLYYYEDDASWNYARKNYHYEYDSQASTSKYEVYKDYCHGTVDLYGNMVLPAHWEYYAFSKDLSSCIFWRERKSDGSIFDKKHYIRISKEDLLPKAVNRDFLND